MACYNNHFEVVEILLKYNPNLNLIENGNSWMSLIANRGHIDLFRYLKDKVTINSARDALAVAVRYH